MGSSPRRADACLGSAHARNYTEHAGKSRPKMRDGTATGYIKIASCLNEEK